MKQPKNPTMARPASTGTQDPAEALLANLEQQGISVTRVSPPGCAPAIGLEIEPEHWGTIAKTASTLGFRWAGGWAIDDSGATPTFQPTVFACLEKQAQFLLVRAKVKPGQHSPPSQARWFPGANRPERHTRDAFGVDFAGQPDPRPWLRHKAWTTSQFPLRKDFPAAGTPLAITPPGNDYAFHQAEGSGVYEIPVGPIHAGIIEPGHFRFLAVGEQVLNLEERLGYVHKGIEKLAEGREPMGLARLAGRVSGDTTVGHAFAACQAMERAAGVTPPPRSLILRGILSERERVANHLGDIGAICNDVAFTFAFYQYTRLRELWLRNNRAWFGHRLLMDQIMPGGVATDLPANASETMREEIARLKKELDPLRAILDDNASLQDRLQEAGILPRDTARALGCLGYVGRASGLDHDLRRDAPYAPYDRIEVKAIAHGKGDVRARLDVRYDEIHAALDIIEQLVDQLSEGDILATWQTPEDGAEGMGLVEGWRGEILCYVRFGPDNRISRYYPRDPSVFNWPALEHLIHGNIVPDFPLCNKSVNGSYSGHDL